MIEQFDLISFDSKSNCCGCRVCETICSVGAISMMEDSEGFIYPSVNILSCVNCGLCEKSCPFINIDKKPRCEKVFSCYSLDDSVRNNASSGGIFELLARQTITEGGVVFGAAFDEQLTLKHMYTDNLHDLKKLCKSKYIQSDTNGAFVKVKDFLLENKRVLFVGTPCQVSALNNYLGKTYDRLLSVDFICHGVPSDKMFKSYLHSEEQRRDGKIKSFLFRVKDGNAKHVHGYSYTLERNEKSKVYKGMFYDNPFYFGFKKYLFLRPSCYSCKYCTPERVADITLADFWGIEDFLPNVDFNKGVSMVLVNSQKGKTAFNSVYKSIKIAQFDIDIAIRCNHCLAAPTKLPSNREILMQDYLDMPFKKFAKKYIMSNKVIIYRIYYALPVFVRKRLIKLFKRISYV